MRLKGRIEKLEIHKGKKQPIEIRFLVPDDWEGEVPEGHYRESEMPPWEYETGIRLSIMDVLDDTPRED